MPVFDVDAVVYEKVNCTYMVEANSKEEAEMKAEAEECLKRTPKEDTRSLYSVNVQAVRQR